MRIHRWAVGGLVALCAWWAWLPLAAAGAEPLELLFWNFWDPALVRPVIERFEAEHPGVRIRSEQLPWNTGLDKVVTAVAAGRAPDICELGSTWMGRFMAQGVLLDLSSATAELLAHYRLAEAVTWEGRTYGLPWMVSTRVLFFNQALFRAAGLDPSRPPATWDELLAAARAIHRPAERIYGFGMNAGEAHVLYKKFLPFVWGAGGDVLDPDGRLVFDGPATRDALAFWGRLREYSYLEKQDLLDEAFMKGSLGLEISGSWNLARFPREAPGLEFGVARLPRPAADRGASTSFTGGQVVALFKNCRHPGLGLDFIKFLTRPEHTLPITRATMVSFPAHRGAYGDPLFTEDPRMQVFVQQLETACHPPIHPQWVELEAIVNQAIERVVVAGEPAASALARAAQAWQEVLARARARRLEPASGPGPVGRPAPWSTALLLLGVTGLLLGAILLAGWRGPRGPWSVPPARLVFLLPWLTTFVLFWIYPLLFSLAVSFTDFDILHPEAIRLVGAGNFVRLWHDAEFRRAFVNTVRFVLGTVPTTTLLGLALALLVQQVRIGQRILRSAFFLPSILSMVVVATIFKSFYAPDGAVNAVLGLVGLPGRAWLVEPAWALPAIMALEVWATAGFAMILFLAALQAIPPQLYEAAEVDGASAWQRFRFVTLPMIRPMTLFVVVVTTIRTWQVFPEVFTLTRGGPLGATDTLVHRLYETAFRFHEMGYASAMAWILLLIVLGLSLLQMRLLGERSP
ncbi:MAG: Maltose/maltodextrinABC transport system II, permease protein 1 [Candidatus Ozemobacter sibiricus]|jgi:multiple sugar transport system permease protein|uniref:Maltose/maltodextrinABC transport system II, permease protein 1 n=1 Tax=Candidatus Ozemobacter sibiricus TaxID=2268124 RepID=A0A367ZJJ9_9BACT|nr:MAG: Maltose/maltodextrinABC transport system II, permease protein 1 [Candidatus Ozemobacter sibiricus]